MRKCSVCGDEVFLDKSFCRKCNMVFCSNCNALNYTCPRCGSELTEVPRGAKNIKEAPKTKEPSLRTCSKCGQPVFLENVWCENCRQVVCSSCNAPGQRCPDCGNKLSPLPDKKTADLFVKKAPKKSKKTHKCSECGEEIIIKNSYCENCARFFCSNCNAPGEKCPVCGRLLAVPKTD